MFQVKTDSHAKVSDTYNPSCKIDKNLQFPSIFQNQMLESWRKKRQLISIFSWKR